VNLGRLLAKAAAGETEPWDVLSLPAVATGKNQYPEDRRRPGDRAQSISPS
jgi:hypothetical protein